jgi:hypothetical protein
MYYNKNVTPLVLIAFALFPEQAVETVPQSRTTLDSFLFSKQGLETVPKP